MSQDTTLLHVYGWRREAGRWYSASGAARSGGLRAGAGCG
jgi:hypothetical protein